MLQPLEHLSGHQVDPVPVQSQLQQLMLVLEGARLHGRDGVVLETSRDVEGTIWKICCSQRVEDAILENK